MTKVVYNACYGGFNLSKEACQRYWDIKGAQVWIEDDTRFKIIGIFVVWLVAPEHRIPLKDADEFYSMSKDEHIEYTRKYSSQTWSYDSISRHDLVLVQVVEQLGSEANGEYANLQIQEVYKPYHIDNYDGYESVKTADNYDWITP